MSGFPEEYVTDLVDRTRKVVELGLQGLSRPDEVFQAVVRLKFALLKARDIDQKPGWAKVVKALAISLGGAGLVTLNATGLAVSMSITGPLSALSGSGWRKPFLVKAQRR